jgi:hypothetical protein
LAIIGLLLPPLLAELRKRGIIATTKRRVRGPQAIPELPDAGHRTDWIDRHGQIDGGRAPELGIAVCDADGSAKLYEGHSCRHRSGVPRHHHGKVDR